MKNTLTTCLVMIATLAACAQQREGRVIYERTLQMQVSFPGMNEEMQRMIPKSRTDKFELNFGNDQSLWKAAEQENEDETIGGDNGGIQIRMAPQGANDVLYNNLANGHTTELREMMDKKFIIDDSVHALKWKMTGETKTILGHPCMKATTTQISQRMQMTMDNGKMERKEVTDTSGIEAWFATDIPVSAGPSQYQGQLPGLILEMNIKNGVQTFKAIEIKEKADMAIIKEPAGKKHYTREEFNKERDKMMEQMRQNGAGPGRVVRFN